MPSEIFLKVIVETLFTQPMGSIQIKSFKIILHVSGFIIPDGKNRYYSALYKISFRTIRMILTQIYSTC